MKSRLKTFILIGLLALSTMALAIFPKLSNTLIGVTTNGMTPSGTIRVDQSKLNAQPALVEVRLQNVNLPNGTEVGLIVDRQFYGTFSVNRLQINGQLSTYLQTGRTASIAMVLEDGTLIAYQTASWKT